jgi:hypothetical protein
VLDKPKEEQLAAATSKRAKAAPETVAVPDTVPKGYIPEIDEIEAAEEARGDLLCRFDEIMESGNELATALAEIKTLIDENARLKMQVSALVQARDQMQTAYEAATRRANSFNAKLNRLTDKKKAA